MLLLQIFFRVPGNYLQEKAHTKHFRELRYSSLKWGPRNDCVLGSYDIFMSCIDNISCNQ